MCKIEWTTVSIPILIQQGQVSQVLSRILLAATGVLLHHHHQSNCGAGVTVHAMGRMRCKPCPTKIKAPFTIIRLEKTLPMIR